MSVISRANLQLVASIIGMAQSRLTPVIGDTSANPGTLLGLEAMLARLRTATRFHDTDTALILTPELTFGSADNVGLGVQSAYADVVPESYDFPSLPTGQNAPNWNPGYKGLPCPEGWYSGGGNNDNNYHGWENYQSGAEDYMPPNPSLRYTYAYPTRYDTSSDTYIQVPYFERGRFISLYNNTGSSIDTSSHAIKFTLPLNIVSGTKVFYMNPGLKQNMPLDILFYTNSILIQSYSSGTWGSISLPTSGETFPGCPYLLSLNDNFEYVVTINLPTATWPVNTYWHLVMYWGSQDVFAFNNRFTSSPGSTSPINISTTKIWPTKNFFDINTTDTVNWVQTGINAGAALVATNRTHYDYYDGTQVSLTDPGAYGLGIALFDAATDWGNIDIPYNCAVCVRVVGNFQVGSGVSPTSLIGPVVPPEHFPADWSMCPYFPSEPENAVTLALLVLKRANNRRYGLVNTPDNSSSFVVEVAWMKQNVISYAMPPINDPEFISIMLPNLLSCVQRHRNIDVSQIFGLLINNIVCPAIGIPTFLLTNAAALNNPSGIPAQVLHDFLKTPVTPALQPSADEDLSIALDTYGQSAIAYASQIDPSLEFMRFDANSLYLIDRTLFNPNTLELYMVPGMQCQTVDDPTSPGNRLGLDYTLRLEIIDPNQNTFHKDWYIMASQYYLTPEEWSERIANNLTLIGYYSDATIATVNNGITQYRLYGTAGLVPNLSAGQSVVLATREVSPPDVTQTTYAQFAADNGGPGSPGFIDALENFNDAGNTFYVVNTFQYPNLFTKIKSVGLTSSVYTYTNPYWITNIDYLFTGTQPSDFVIFQNNSNNIGYDYQLPMSSIGGGSGSFSSSSGGSSSSPTLISNPVAIRIVATEASLFYEFSVRLKVELSTTFSVLSNALTDYFSFTLYTDTGGYPNLSNPVGVFANVPFNDITAQTYSVISTNLGLPQYSLASETPYWIVITLSNVPIGGKFYMETTNAVSGTIKHFVNSSWVSDTGAPWIQLASIAQPRADSFTIAQSGYNIGDLEQYGNYAPTYVSPNGNPWPGTSDKAIASQFALNISMNDISQDYDITALSVQLKQTYTSQTPPSGFFNVALYDDNSGVPNSIISDIFTIDYNSLTSSYTVVKLPIKYTLKAGSQYWLVFTPTPAPTTQDAYSTYINCGDNSSSSSGSSSSNLVNYQVYIAESSSSSGSGGSATYEWTPVYNTIAALQLYGSVPTVLGAFNRSSDNITTYLPPPNNLRQATTYTVESTCSFTCMLLNTPSSITIYPRAINNSGTWEYVRFSEDCYFVVRVSVGGEVRTFFGQFHARQDNEAADGPIVVGDDGTINTAWVADSLVYFGIAKTAEDLNTPTTGAPAGDVLALRSS